jgi:uncharacterized protein (TIGR02452 family)
MSLKDAAADTLAILEAGSYTAPSGASRQIGDALASAAAGTCLYAPGHSFLPVRKAHVARIEVRDGTTQEVARQLVQDEAVDDLVLLNFASARNPGGGFLTGAKAQEEDVARCSGLYPCLLTQPRYYEVNRATDSMLYTDHIIYSPRVPFFRTHSKGTLENPFVASIITAPAPNAGQHLARHPDDQRELDETLRRRAGLVLAVALDRGHSAVLLGAWGCGVFRNDPAAVADAFGNWLEGEYADAFKRVVFGFHDSSKDKHTLAAFRARFRA